MKKVMTIKETSEVFSIGINKLRLLAKNDPTLPVIRIGERKILIVTELMEDWIKKVVEEGRRI